MGSRSCLAGMLIGCGQKGPLVHPDAPKHKKVLPGSHARDHAAANHGARRPHLRLRQHRRLSPPDTPSETPDPLTPGL